MINIESICAKEMNSEAPVTVTVIWWSFLVVLLPIDISFFNSGMIVDCELVQGDRWDEYNQLTGPLAIDHMLYISYPGQVGGITIANVLYAEYNHPGQKYVNSSPLGDILVEPIASTMEDQRYFHLGMD